MPKKRRNLISSSSDVYYSPDKKIKDIMKDNDVVWMARGRLKGALQDALDPNPDADSSNENTPIKLEKNSGLAEAKISSNAKRDLNELSCDNDEYASDRSDKRVSCRKRLLSPNRSNSYVMKLFDRSVDLAQFKEDTPLYPICRAWMANQPRNAFRPKSPEPESEDLSFCKIDLPSPEGPVIPRVPPLLPEQLHYGKLNINFNYNEMSPPSIDVLLNMHKSRWSAVRRNWFEQSVKYEGRYAKTQEILKEMDTNS